MLSEQDDEWQVARRYMSLESLAKVNMNVIEGDCEDSEKEVKELLPAAF